MILLRSEFGDKISNIINYRKQVNIILELKNIKTIDGIISAEYDPANSGDLGSVSINIESGEVVKSTISQLDEPLPIYLHHAIQALKKLVIEKNLPKEKLVMWY